MTSCGSCPGRGRTLLSSPKTKTKGKYEEVSSGNNTTSTDILVDLCLEFRRTKNVNEYLFVENKEGGREEIH